MIKKKSTLENIMTVSLPFLAFLLLILANFVQFGFVRPDENWWWQLILNAVAMIGFWVPARLYASQKAMESDRIKQFEAQYIAQVQRVYSNNEVAALREWCKKLYDQKVDDFIDRRIQNAGVDRAVFDTEYKNNNPAIYAARKEKRITRMQAKLLKSANKFRKIRPASIDDLLPNLIKNSDYRTIDNTYAIGVNLKIMRKLCNCIIFAVALSMVTVTIDFSMPAMSIITALALRLFTGCANFLSGLWTGKSLINKNYANDINSKTLLLEEFHAVSCGNKNGM